MTDKKYGQCSAEKCERGAVEIFPYCYQCLTDPMREEYIKHRNNELNS